MTTDSKRAQPGTPLSADTAFVVHVTTMGPDAPEAVWGRIEHITTGRSTRFASVGELLGFMRLLLDEA